ncbi:penicillin-binding transpeptidase domain-containing protein, partial [Staphylococcus aureus]
RYIVPNTKKEQQPKRGYYVHLTFDSNIKVFVEEALDGMVEKYLTKDVFAVVMNARTGEIIAFSQRPTFNPETDKDFGNKWAND